MGAVAFEFAVAALPSIVDKVVIGISSADEVAMNAAAIAEAMPISIWAEAQALGLIAPDIPVPKYES